MTQTTPPTTREHQVLDLLIHLHGEYGPDATFTRPAVQHLMESPIAGSLAGLALQNLVTQHAHDGDLAYQVTEAGYAHWASIHSLSPRAA